MVVGPLVDPANADVSLDGAGASYDCSEAVIDETGLLDAEVVEATIARVEEATVLVRAYEAAPPGGLAGDTDATAVCSDTADATSNGELVIISFSVADRRSAVFSGPTISPRSDPDAVRESMSAQFADGDFTGGVVTGIDTLADDLAASWSSGELVTNGDLNGGSGPSFVPLIGVVGAVAIGGGGLYLWRRRRSLTELRSTFERDVATPRTRVGAAREQGLRVEADADLWARVSAGKTLTVLHEKRKAVRDAGKATEGAASLLGAATPDGIGRASSGQIGDARRRLIDLNTALDQNELAIGQLLAFGAHVDHLRVALPAKRELLLRELASAEHLTEQRRDGGFNVDDAEAELRAVRAMVQPLEFYELALDHLTLSERIEVAEAKLFAADHDLQVMPDRPGALTQWRAELVRAIAAEHDRSEKREARLTELQSEHGTESWSWAISHPDRARQLLATALATAAGAEPLVDAQEFDEAGRALESAGMELIGADTLLDEIDDLIIDLEQAKIEAAGILAESQQVLGQFAAFVTGHAGDLDATMRFEPERLAGALAGLAAELTTERPNYLRVAETAEHINRELDELMITAQEQHQAMEALRRQAVREIARAQRNLRRARESLGWELVQSEDARAIERLAMALGQLPTSPGARAYAATRIADDALVIQDRIIARRRRNANWVVVGGANPSRGSSWGHPPPPGPWSHGPGGGIGGGGSRSFGGGGGGSRSFGGGRSSGSW
jgi:LPXTG-motif cell wall-anchored protein